GADAADPVTTGLAGGHHETLPEEERLVIPWPIARLALTLGGNCSRARQRRHGDEDDAGSIGGTQDVRCGGTAVRRPPRPGPSRPCRASPKIWASRWSR